MEATKRIKTTDGKTIYGTLNTSSKQSRTLIVFVHGLTGHQNEHHFYNAARFFTKKGFDTFRFDLYNGEKGGRRLVDCTVETHSADLNTVLRTFRKKYGKIAVVGHSLGGPTIGLADTNLIDAIVLWDPSDMPDLEDIVEDMERPMRYVKSLNAYVFDWGVSFLLGKKMAKQFDTLDAAALAAGIHKPIKIIVAENGNKKAGKNYYKQANEPKDFVVIKKAGHTFDEEGTEEELFAETLSWIKKHTK